MANKKGKATSPSRGREVKSLRPTVSSNEESNESDATNHGPQMLSDDAIVNREQDLLGRSRFADAVAQSIISRKDNSGLVLGLYGAWGEGKTSVLRLVLESLSAFDVIEPLWFNPWYFHSEQQLVEVFFATLAGKLKLKLGTIGSEMHRVLTKYGSMVSIVPTEIVGLPNPGKAIKEAGKLFSKASIEDLKSQIEAALDESGVRVVVFIDDVDRLESEEVQAVLKLVKLTGGFRNLVYVLAFDDVAVARAVSSRYGGNLQAGRDFLDKIVQVPLRLPPADPLAILKIALAGVDASVTESGSTITQEGANEYRRYFDPLFNARVRTLRATKRYVNSLGFALPLLIGEANVVDLMLLEALRVFYPTVYAAIPANREIFVYAVSSALGDKRDVTERRKNSFDQILDGLSLAEKLALQELLEYLFPRLKTVTQNYHFGSDWEADWARNQRAASTDYFDRYFQYAIPGSDVSDVAIEQFLKELAIAGHSEASELFRAFTTRESAERVIAKLRLRELDMEPAAARALVPVLVASGSQMPGEGSFMSFVSPFGQVTYLINALIRRLPRDDRADVASDALTKAEPLSFAINLWRAIRRPKEANPDTGTLPEDKEDTLRLVIASRLTDEAAKEPFYYRPKEQASTLFSAWSFFGDKIETQRQLTKNFDDKPEDAAAFIASLVRTAWGSDGLPAESDLDRDQYDLIGKLIDHDSLMAYLRKIYGDSVDQIRERPTKARFSDAAARAAHEYAYLHRIITERERGAAQLADDGGSSPDA